MITLAHMKPATLITAVVLLIIAIVHLVRLIYQTNVTVGTVALPVWVSAIAVVITAGLAIWLWRENR